MDDQNATAATADDMQAQPADSDDVRLNETHDQADAAPADDLEILTALHSQVERIGLDRGPMSPVERRLANAILVMLNVMINERTQPASAPESAAV